MRILDARRLFGDLEVVHMATTLPDGSPHVVPLWFVWREEAIYISARRESSTWRNIERDPRVALTFHRGRAWQDLAGLAIHGRAEPLVAEHPALRGVMSAWYEKYRPMLAGEGFRAFAEQVDRPGMVRVRALRIADWDHALWAGEAGGGRSEPWGAHG